MAWTVPELPCAGPSCPGLEEKEKSSTNRPGIQALNDKQCYVGTIVMADREEEHRGLRDKTRGTPILALS